MNSAPPPRSDQNRHAAFSRLDLLALLAAGAVLLTLGWPVLAGSRQHADRIACASNLRQMLVAYHLWGNDHGDALPIRTSSCRGGLQPVCATPAVAFIDNAWFHFAWISNELVSPRLLACPGDPETRVATDFSTAPDYGLLHPNFRSRAVSYTVALDTYPGQTQLLVSSDRNLSVTARSSIGCSSGVFTGASLDPGATNVWNPGPHGQTGNLALYDGHVLETSSDELDRYLRETLPQQRDAGIFHVLLPRY